MAEKTMAEKKAMVEVAMATAEEAGLVVVEETLSHLESLLVLVPVGAVTEMVTVEVVTEMVVVVALV